MSRTLSECMDNVLGDTDDTEVFMPLINALNQKTTIQEWLIHFGQERLTVLDYNLSIKKYKIEHIFLKCLNIEKKYSDDFFYQGHFINKSLNLEVLELKRLLNKVIKRNELDLNAEMDIKLQNYSDVQISRELDLDMLTHDQIQKLSIAFNLEFKHKAVRKYNPKLLHDAKFFLQKENIKKIFPKHLEVYIKECVSHYLKNNQYDPEILWLADIFEPKNVNLTKANTKKPTPKQLSQKNSNNINLQIKLAYNKAITHEMNGDLAEASKVINFLLKKAPNNSKILQLKNRLDNSLAYDKNHDQKPHHIVWHFVWDSIK